MDTTEFGAISPTLVQDCSQAPTQVLLSPRSQRLDALQPPPPALLPSLFPLPSAGRYCRAAPGVHGVGAVDRDCCLAARGPDAVPPGEVAEMKIAEKEDDESEGHDGFPTELLEGEVATASRPDMRRIESPHPWRERRHQVGHHSLGGFGDDLVVRVRGRSCLTACHAFELSPCPSPCRGGKARGQDEGWPRR